MNGCATPGGCATPSEGWHGWDAYAPFYDWENRRTQGRRDVRFWEDLASRADGTVLELGCGTGRLSLPVARAAARFVGVDRSMPMLRQLRAKLRRDGLSDRASIVRGDIRALPFRRRWRCGLVMAPYGMLQSLLTDADLDAAVAAAAGVLPPGGMLGIDLAAGLARWREYDREEVLQGRMAGGRRVTLIESVRQAPGDGLTVFDQEFVESLGSRRSVHRFSIAFRTVTVPRMADHLERAGFTVDAVLGDYHGAEWSPDADVWVIIARRRGSIPARTAPRAGRS